MWQVAASGAETMSRDDDLAGGPLSDAEVKRLRRLLRDEDRAKYFWRTLRIWGSWGGGVIGGIYIGWDTISKAVRALAHAFYGSGP